jgi:hypothetical protein
MPSGVSLVCWERTLHIPPSASPSGGRAAVAAGSGHTAASELPVHQGRSQRRGAYFAWDCNGTGAN